MKKRTLLMIGLGLLVGAAGAGAWWWIETGNQQALVSAALPPIPDLSGVVGPLRERIAAADARALTRSDASDGLAELSRLYHANGFYAEAIRCYEGLEKIEPREPRWPHRHAAILAGYGEVEPALALWRRTAELAPDYIPALLRIGDCELKSNRPAKAVEAYSHVLKLSPGEPHAELGLARVDFEAGRWEQTRARLEPLVTRTKFQLGYDLIVSVYERLGRRDLADAIRGTTKAFGAYRDPADPWVDSLLDDCFDPYRLALTAGTFALTGGKDQAIKLLERAVMLAPNDISAHFQLGMVHAQMGNLNVARAEFERCTVLDPSFSDAWAHLSALYERRGEHATAEQVLAAGLRHCPESPGLHLMHARNLRAAGNIQAAAYEFTLAARLRPNEPEAYSEHGAMLIGAGRTEDGIALMRQALETDPGNPSVLGLLAMNAISTGNLEESNSWLNRVTKQPRVPQEQSARLLRAYREQFGRDWRG
jgi:tetratricopeptide (TPR) repeat protein